MRSLSRSVSSRVTSAPMPSAMLAAFCPDTPAPRMTTLAFATPPTPPMSTPRPALGAQERVRAHLGREAAGDLGHRVEQRQRTGGQLHRLVGDAGDLARGELLGERLVGGEVQVGEEGQTLAHAVVLLRHGLLDLEHHVGLGPHVVGGVDDAGPGGHVVGVADLRPDAGALLHEDLVSVLGELVRPHGRQGDAVLVVLHLAWNADLHAAHPSGLTTSGRAAVARPAAACRAARPL